MIPETPSTNQTIFENIIFNEDCITGMRARIPGESIDLIVTSPPFNLGIEYDGYNDDRPYDEYLAWSKEWMQECYRVLKPDGRMCLNQYLSCGTSEFRFGPIMDLNYIACHQIGFHHHGVGLLNDKTLTKRTAWGSWLSARAPYLNSPYEVVLVLFKDHWRKDNEGISTILSKEFQEISMGTWKVQGKIRKEHPAPFPDEVPRKCVRFLSYQNDIVLDPFMGEGTTAVIAKQERRRYVGFETSPKYCRKSAENLSQELLVS